MSTRQSLADLLLGSWSSIKEDTVRRALEHDPTLLARYGERGRLKCEEDTEYHLKFLREALLLENPRLFVDYIAWAGTMLEARGIPTTDLDNHLVAIREAVLAASGDETTEELLAYVPSVAAAGMSSLPDGNEGRVRAYLDALLSGNRKAATAVLTDTIEGGMAPIEVFVNVLQPALRSIGDMWQRNEITVAHEHYCTSATEAIMAELYPLLIPESYGPHKVLLACVPGEQHALGCRILADTFDSSGWQTRYLGPNTPIRDLIKLINEFQPDIVALSVTMVTNLMAARETIVAIREQCGAVPVMVGGRPFTAVGDLADRLGADATAGDAISALYVAQRLVFPSGDAKGAPGAGRP